MEAAIKFKDGIVDRNHKGLSGMIKADGVDLISGVAKLKDQSTVTVSTDEGELELDAKNIILATGSEREGARRRAPRLPGTALGRPAVGRFRVRGARRAGEAQRSRLDLLPHLRRVQLPPQEPLDHRARAACPRPARVRT